MKPESYGITFTLEGAKAVRREVQSSLKGDGRKAHYTKVKGSTNYYVWIDPLNKSKVTEAKKDVKQ